MRDHVEIGHLTMFDALRLNREQVCDRILEWLFFFWSTLLIVSSMYIDQKELFLYISKHHNRVENTTNIRIFLRKFTML